MVTFLTQVLSILTSSPGNLAYHVVLAFSIAGALQSSINHWRRSGFPQGQRMVIGLILLLVVQLVQFASTALGWQRVVDPRTFLPPLDRAVILLGLVIIAWLWLFPEPSRLADSASLLLSVLVLIAFAMSWIWWRSQPSGMAYNGTYADIGSDMLAIILTAVSALVLPFRRPNGWGIGLAFFGLMLVGFLARWLEPASEGDYAGTVRLAQLMAYPWLFSLPQRFPVPVEAERSQQPAPLSDKKEVRRYRTDPSFITEFLELASEPDPLQRNRNITRLVSELMVADITLMILPPDETGNAIVSTGYDLIKQQPVDGFALEVRSIPVLTSALRRGRNLRLPSSSTSSDLVSLARALDLDRAGHLLSVPLTVQDGTTRSGLVLLLPYSNRGWTVEDQNNLVRLSNALSHILLEKEEVQAIPPTRSELGAISGEWTLDPQAQIEILQEQLTQERDRSESLAGLILDQDAARERIVKLEQENLALQSSLEAGDQVSKENVQQMRGELRLALEEVDRLNKVITAADIAEVEPGSTTGEVPEPNERLREVIHELRRPLTSIVENTSLLQGEAAQSTASEMRKPVERIKASAERLIVLVEDLVRYADLSHSDRPVKSEVVDLNQAVDDAVAYALPLFGQKKISLSVETPGQLPVFHLNRDALYQVMSALLECAGDSSPENGEVSFHVQVESKENEPDFLLIQVSDSGVGIPPDELSRVFSRVFSMDDQNKAEVQSLADIKALVEAQQGRMWVDSSAGQGSTYSVLLPAKGDEMALPTVDGPSL